MTLAHRLCEGLINLKIGFVMTDDRKAERTWGLEKHGITKTGIVHWDLAPPAIYEQAIIRHEGMISHLGPLVVRTGHHTGRSPNDKYIVENSANRDEIWWGTANRPMSQNKFDQLYERQLAYLRSKDLYVANCYVGADAKYQVPIRVITELAWQNLFARNMFIREPDIQKQLHHSPSFTVVCTPEFHAIPETDGTSSEVFVILNIERGLIIIGGTRYAGEIKKSIFSLMQYILPKRGVLSMHSSANYGETRNDVALFLGLSGTGKTTLATTNDRILIGDDEHGWSDEGIFNLEGGCYAKTIRLRQDSEPEVFETTRKFGTILENVGIDPITRYLDLDDNSLTENTRAAYPITHIPRADYSGTAGHPKHIIFLTYDAFGVLPPVAKLSLEQTSYHFLSGYTSKVAGTEAGVNEPQVVFSPCYGAPFLPLPPSTYGELLKQKIKTHKVNCWLVNTGMSGGAPGIGKRMPIAVSRAIVSSILDGTLAQVATQKGSVLDLEFPVECHDVPNKILNPRESWSDQSAYDKSARKLTKYFEENYESLNQH